MVASWRTTPRKCRHCGATFKAVQPGQYYCSGECRRDRYTVVQRPPRHCAHCGRLFLPKQTAQKYCCPQCYEDATAAHRLDKAWRTEVRTCVICGANFTPNTRHQQTCSRRCSLELNTINSGNKKLKPSASSINKQTGLKYSRKCHDCGEPTNDYRCAKCLQKWRDKNKDSFDDYPLDSYTVGKKHI